MKKTAILFLWLLFTYKMLRVCFWLMHYPTIETADVLESFLWGFRSDFTFLFFLNFPVWAYLLATPHLFRFKRYTDTLFLIYFILSNSVFLLLNYIDLFYFQFTKRRTTIHVLSIIQDSRHVLDEYLFVYWLPFLIFFIFLIFFFYITSRIFLYRELVDYYSNRYFKWILPPFLLALGLLFSRGIERAPFQPVTLYLHVDASLQPLASNTGFSMLYSLLKPQTLLENKTYFDSTQLDKQFSLNRNYKNSRGFQKKNVVIFILESFSRELLDSASPKKAYTPFLDSIGKQGITCLNSYANAAESNKGIVAILGSIPSFFTEPYFHSVYASNNLNGIGSMLVNEGYTTSFFMGANKDHFGFQKWSNMIGISNYYSMEDYDNAAHHDGVWGISDHYFLPYAATIIKKQQLPFFSTIFNLSSHIPFSIPADVKPQIIIRGQSEQQNSITYVDFSIRTFFDYIKNEPWYRNTLFVFAADHSFIMDRKNPPITDILKIPIFIHSPGAAQTRIEKPVQQFDIVPTILDLLHYPKPFYSFGTSMLDQQPGYAYFGQDNNYYIISSEYMLRYASSYEQTEQIHHLKKDSLLENNLAGKPPFAKKQLELEVQLKSFLQRYSEAFINNRLDKP